RAQPTVESVFAATEEAIFVHVVVSARYMLNFCSDDIEKVLTHSPRYVGEGLPDLAVCPWRLQWQDNDIRTGSTCSFGRCHGKYEAICSKSWSQWPRWH
ncbi:unnamed protein product, partial [Urochloa humidicola]